ncbi:MAG: DUF1287 domain-containing protein [Alistipes sp.]|nr:DUF1287 domain-containing protein [Alistipes sp.]
MYRTGKIYKPLVTAVFFFALVPFGLRAQEDFTARLCRAAVELTRDAVRYDPSYYTIPYPGGDVPADRGVCTDVVIRAYRKLGIDLQKEVHEDMKANFSLYPANWGLSRTDTNIDHRRVPNLMTFFSRKGVVLPVTGDITDYNPGDIVCWMLPGNLTHIGIVTDHRAASGNWCIVHNIGAGQVLEDILFRFDIIGHYRYGE